MPPEMEDMADAAEKAEPQAQAALDSGADPSEAASAAIDAAAGVMTDMGAPPEMVDTMASSANEGFTEAIESGMGPMEALMQELVVDTAMEAEFGPMGPPPGDMGPDMGLWTR